MLRDIIGKRRAAPAASPSKGYSPVVDSQPLYQPFAESHPSAMESYEPEPECNMLSSDVEICGSLSFSSDLIFDGRMEGDIISGGCLTLGENAVVKGVIRSEVLVVYGRVEGDICVKGRCDLRSTSSIYGNITSTLLTMEPGASFFGEGAVGTFEMASAEEEAPVSYEEEAPAMELVEEPIAMQEPAPAPHMELVTNEEVEEETSDFLLDTPAEEMEEAPKRANVRLSDVLAEIKPLAKAA